MAQAFRSGKLPEPLPIPSGSPDDAAIDLAKKIAAADEQSTAALMTAIQMAGFSIRAKGGTISFVPKGPSQGMAFDTFSVAAMAKLYCDGWAISLADLTVVLGKTVHTLEDAPLNQVLLQGIAKASEGDQPLRFWARTIVELGRNASPTYDLMNPKVDPANVQLNAIQVTFILQRIAGDLSTRARPNVLAARALYQPLHRNHRVSFQPAVFHPSDRADFLLAADGSSGSLGSPCGDTAETLLDAIAILKSTEWGNLVGIADKEAGVVGMGGVNAVLAILRFIYVYASMNVQITMDNPPLVRTPEGPVTQDMRYKGQTRTLTAHVWFEIHDWPCVLWILMRGAMSNNELDVGNLPHNGAAEGVGVEWELIDGGVPKNVNSGDSGFLEAQHSAIVMFDNGPGTDGATWNKETDANGNSVIKVSGRPQLYDMTNIKRVPVMKSMSVLVSIAYKHNGASEKMLDEFLDVLGPAAGFASGDILGGLVGGITETMFRMHWYSSGIFEFPVKDWVPCSSGWGGTISYSWKIAGAHTSGGGHITNSDNTELTETGEIQLRGNASGSEGQDGSSNGTFSSTYETRRNARSNLAGCVSFVNEGSTSSGNGDAKCQISVQGDNKYQIGCGSESNLEGQFWRHFSKGGACPPSTLPPDEAGPVKGPATFFPAVTALADPNRPGALHGSTTSSSGVQSTQVSWDLTLCK
jgi:hypothetical protein